MSLSIHLVINCGEENSTAYMCNLTANLLPMAKAANLEFLWELSYQCDHKAQDLIEPLTAGLGRLLASPEVFKQYNPSNGWGSYETLVDSIARLLDNCRKHHLCNVY